MLVVNRAVVGPGDNIVIPAASKLTREQMDWEVELAVVIGKP
jgi:2-keto-4-pentenoate hydratase/2-oxohepta-3-ene-1,7-dioic acid hydratase in catechol pathway